MDSRCSTGAISQAHFPDEIANFFGHFWTPFPMATFPCSVESKTFAMPCNYCLGFDYEESGSPTRPQSRTPNPQQRDKSVGVMGAPQFRALHYKVFFFWQIFLRLQKAPLGKKPPKRR